VGTKPADQAWPPSEGTRSHLIEVRPAVEARLEPPLQDFDGERHSPHCTSLVLTETCDGLSTGSLEVSHALRPQVSATLRGQSVPESPSGMTFGTETSANRTGLSSSCVLIEASATFQVERNG
jgi:hypothetical protein